MALAVKNPPADAGDWGSIPGLGRFPGGGHGNPLEYSCLENPMDRGAWWATFHRAEQSQARLKQLSAHAHSLCHVEANTFKDLLSVLACALTQAS